MAADSELLQNSRYRQYMAAIDKALKTFEYSTEWADLISALAKLHKVISSNSKFKHVPKPVTVSKRLAQCLHPALPSGVHLKALEVYRQVFEVLGAAGTATHLHLYSIGLFPLMGFGGIKVKDELLKLFTDHLLPLGAQIRPAVVGLLSGALLGLEEGSEFFDKTNSFVERLQQAVGGEYLFACVWHCVAASPSVRLPALIYVTNHVDRLRSMDDQLFVMGGSIERTVLALCAAADDAQTLVQRHLLDFLCAVFPLDSEQLVRADKVRLLARCLFVLLKRDMSLNRRLYAWLLGAPPSPVAAAAAADDDDDDRLEYFRRVALPLAVDALRQRLGDGSVLLVCRLLVYLLDRADIGPIIIDRVLFDVLHTGFVSSAATTSLTLSKSANLNWRRANGSKPPDVTVDDDFEKTLNLLLNSLEPSFLWIYLAKQMTVAKERDATFLTVFEHVCACSLAAVQLDSHWLIRTQYLPRFLNAVLAFLSEQFVSCSHDDLLCLMRLSHRLMLAIQQSSNAAVHECVMSTAVGDAGGGAQRDAVVGAEGQDIVEGCWVELQAVIAAVARWFLSGGVVSAEAKRLVVFACCSLLGAFSDFPIYCTAADEMGGDEKAAGLPRWASSLCSVALNRRCIDLQAEAAAVDALTCLAVVSRAILEQHDALSSRRSSFSSVDGANAPLPRHDQTAGTAVLLKPLLGRAGLTALDEGSFYESAAQRLWQSLGEGRETFHEMAARLLCLLHSRDDSLGSSVLEDIFLNDLTSPDQNVCLSAIKKFCNYWSLTRRFYTGEALCVGVRAKFLSRSVGVVLGLLTSPLGDDMELHRELLLDWFDDCVNHGDLPSILQCVCLLLLNPRSARVSTQYMTEVTPAQTRVRLTSVQTPAGFCLHHAHSDAPLAADRAADLRRALLSSRRAAPQRSSQQTAVTADEFTGGLDDLSSVSSTSDYESERPEDVVAEVMQSILDQVCGFEDERDGSVERHATPPSVVMRRCTDSNDSLLSELRALDSRAPDSDASALFHPLHAHILFYVEAAADVDLSRARHLFRALAFLLAHPHTRSSFGRPVVSCMLSATTSSCRDAQTSQRLCDLMQRHARSILGQDFWDEAESVVKHKTYVLLELFVSVSLHHLRSYFLNNPISVANASNVEMNWKTKIAAADLLSRTMAELAALLRDNRSQSMASFVADLLAKCRLQKCLLHCLMASVHDSNAAVANQDRPLSTDVAAFNRSGRGCRQLADACEAAILDLTCAVVELEAELSAVQAAPSQNASGIVLAKLSVQQQISPLHNRSNAPLPLVDLRLFVLTLLNALKRRPHSHAVWLRAVWRLLPFLDKSLPALLLHAVEQLCSNLEAAVDAAYGDAPHNAADVDCWPTNYVCTVLESVTALVHYALLDGAAADAPPRSPRDSLDASTGSKGPTEVLSNLVKVFTFSDSHKSPHAAKTDEQLKARPQAKSDILAGFPHSLSTLCHVWSAVAGSVAPRSPVGAPQQIQRLILDMLSPVALAYPSNFLSSLAMVWLSRAASPLPSDQIPSSSVYSTAQLDVAELLLSLKMLPFDSLITAVAQTLKESAKGKSPDAKDHFPTDVALVELFHACVLSTQTALLRNSALPLLQLLGDASQTFSSNAAVVFVLFTIYADLVRLCYGAGANARVADDRATVKALQDAFQRLTDTVSAIVCWQLEQTTWIRRTLVVKSDLSGSSANLTADGATGDSLSATSRGGSPVDGLPSPLSSMPKSASVSSLSGAVKRRSHAGKDSNNNRRDGTRSVRALELLAQYMPTLLDVVTKSDDREKLFATVQSAWSNALPFLKTRTARNADSFTAVSRLVAAFSGYSYTRSIWRKATLELINDSSFFNMDSTCAELWLTIVDNVVTYDKSNSTFKDFLARVAASQTAVPFISSKEQENETRALALRRLAFVLLSSQTDQYQSHLPDIQERLAESLRLFQAPHVHAHVLLCFRVMLVRFAPESLTGFWPLLLTELVQCLLMIEQELTVGRQYDSDEWKHARDEQWMQLYLSAAKLLHFLCQLPTSHLSQFQLYEWSFAPPISGDDRLGAVPFLPIATRIASALRPRGSRQCGAVETQPLSQLKSIRSVSALAPFFDSLARPQPRRPDANVADAVRAAAAALLTDFSDGWLC